MNDFMDDEKNRPWFVSVADLEAAQTLARQDEEVIKSAESSGDLALETRASLARNFFMDRPNKQQELEVELAGIAHDLNNLLAAIRGNAELIQRKLGDNKHTKASLGRLLDSTKEAIKLGAQLVAMSKNEQGPLDSMRPFDFLQDFHRMLKEIMEDIMPGNISLSFRSHHNLDSIMIDLTKFHRIFLNLFSNAKDAMPDGGRMLVTVSNVNLPDGNSDRYQSIRPGRHVKVMVTDNGCGIPEEKIERIFDSFFTTKGKQGTGVGLSNVKSMMQEIGGDISVESAVGEGTTFTLFFPSLTAGN